MNQKLSEQVAQLADSLTKAKFATILTGAGISVSSGIPDMEMMDDVFGLFAESTLESRPEVFYQAFHRNFIDPIFAHGPNITHRTIAELERNLFIHGVVTTNVDYLHELAGSHNVAAIWSSLNVNHCLNCGRIYEISVLKNVVPHCPVCGGLISPDPVYRHIATLPDQVRQADEWMDSSDLTIVVGSNGYYSHTSTRQIININPKANAFDHEAKLVIRASAEDTFTELAHQLELKVE
ncbi:SIR2 family NAD-dependent protein deacylase [Furfurilactobacillus curtus]|uniref:protein acetyllysine N-acetyltransferase n=1 Tax=Furfurilactobacillus curtus TaxID=1746200 RepID=A0ABQ5JTB7_9LACO